ARFPGVGVRATSIRAPLRLSWCPGLDSNQHPIAGTRPSTWRVYQFHHLGRRAPEFIGARSRRFNYGFAGAGGAAGGAVGGGGRGGRGGRRLGRLDRLEALRRLARLGRLGLARGRLLGGGRFLLGRGLGRGRGREQVLGGRLGRAAREAEGEDHEQDRAGRRE